MNKKAVAWFPLLLGLILLAGRPADTATLLPSVKELMNFPGYTKADSKKLLAGQIVSHGLKEGSKKELGLTVGMLVSSPLAELVEFDRSGGLLKINREVIEFHNLGDTPADKDTFAGLGFKANEVKEVSQLLRVEPGSTFNLSASEIKRFKSIAKRFKSRDTKKDPAVRETVNSEYRAILVNRYKAYREGGLGAIAPYHRGHGKHAHPGKELANAVKREILMRERMPDFYNAILNYPRDSEDDIQSNFFWIKQLVQDRPTFILVHRIYRYKPGEYAVETFREFYVGHSYNSLHSVMGAFPVKEGTLVFYLNRTSTDQVAGFGSSLKHKIGRLMLRYEVVELFTSIQKSLEQNASQQ